MKAVILAGGRGTRISEESYLKPKPMIAIGDNPIIWHIMKIYSAYGINDFIILLGYKGYVIKEYFADYFLHQSDIRVNLENNTLETLDTHAEKWKITLVDTGLETMTGGRIKRAAKYIGNEPFMLTYGDGVADVNLDALLKSHQSAGKKATITMVQPGGRFGALDVAEDGRVKAFVEKPKGDGAWINGGFFVLEPEVLDYIREGDGTIFERAPLETLAKEGELNGFKHEGFWRPMDTLRDKTELEHLWASGSAPWKIWQ